VSGEDGLPASNGAPSPIVRHKLVGHRHMGAGFLLIMRTGAVRAREIVVEGITRTIYVFLNQRKRIWGVEAGRVASKIAAMVERRYSQNGTVYETSSSCRICIFRRADLNK
jgi:hypothetical protein